MTRRRKEAVFIVTVTLDAKASVADARRELKERANHSAFEFWDMTEIKVKSVKSGKAIKP